MGGRRWSPIPPPPSLAAERGALVVAASPLWLCGDLVVPRGFPLTHISWGGFTGMGCLLCLAWLQLWGTEMPFGTGLLHVPPRFLILPLWQRQVPMGGRFPHHPSQGGHSHAWVFGEV